MDGTAEEGSDEGAYHKATKSCQWQVAKEEGFAAHTQAEVVARGQVPVVT